MEYKNLILTLTATLGLISSVFAGYFYIDNRYALASSHVKLEQRVSVNELQATYNEVRAEYYFLKKQVRQYPDNQELKDELEVVKEQLLDLKKQLNLLKGKK